MVFKLRLVFFDSLYRTESFNTTQKVKNHYGPGQVAVPVLAEGLSVLALRPSFLARGPSVLAGDPSPSWPGAPLRPGQGPWC